MFEVFRLSGTPERSIAMETKKGRPIENSIAAEPDPVSVAHYRSLCTKFGPRWEHRKDACGGYNCYGMALGSRRSAILDEPEVWKSLDDDGYRFFEDPSAARVGDLVLYYAVTPTRERLMHVGVVVDVSLKTPRVLSKWSAAFGEDVHNYRHVIWEGDSLVVRFATDRP